MTAATVDREAGRRLDEAKRHARPRGERRRPGALDVVADDRPAVEVGRDLRPERNLAVRNRPVGKAQREPFAVCVVLRPDLNQRAVAQLVEAPPVRVDDVKPAVLPNTVTFERYGLGVNQPQPFDWGDRDPGHGWHPASVPVPGTGTKPLQKRKQSRAAPSWRPARGILTRCRARRGTRTQVASSTSARAAIAAAASSSMRLTTRCS